MGLSMRRLLKPLWIVVALIFLLEAWLWDHLRPLVGWFVDLVASYDTIPVREKAGPAVLTSDLLALLSRSGQPIFGMMASVYSRLLEEIARRPQDLLRRRIRLGRVRKLWIAARWLLLPPRRSALP